MARKPTGRKNGRPKVDVNQEEFEKLCSLQCTLIEIADWFNCSEDTIQSWCKKIYGECFSVVFKKKSNMGKISLRRSQFKLAEKSASMAIFLGKQYLGQCDMPNHNPNCSDDDTAITSLLDTLKNREVIVDED